MAAKRRVNVGLEDRFLSTNETHDSAEEHLEALTMLEQDHPGLQPVGEAARKLHVMAPSAVQMLKRLAKKGLVEYVDRQGVQLTRTGRKIGTQVVRNGPLCGHPVLPASSRPLKMPA